MADISKMTLKILYTLDNGSSGTYLARSKKPQQVRVASIPSLNSPNDGEMGVGLRIGAVDLSLVLKEIYLNSPELLNGSMARMGFDYNLYYKDICEADEPLVSLGLLSQIRQKLNNRRQHQTEEEIEYDDTTMVIGRVCSNFQALLKKSYSNASKDGSDTDSVIPETLELKLSLIKVVNAKNARKSVPSMPNFPSKVIRPAKPTKRPTNPTPAPKAGRTQSLPIWNMETKDSNGSVNSIARKIYLADRKTELEQMNEPPQNPLAYQVSALQQDNTVQRTKLDTSVSRRFESLANKKKKPQQQQQQQQQQSKKNSNSRKAHAAPKARRCNTMAVIPTPSYESKSLPKKQEKLNTNEDSLNDVVQEMLGGPDDSLPVINDDKENFPPPQQPPVEGGEEGQGIDLDLLNFSELGEMDWFQTFDPFNSPSLVPAANNGEPVKSTTPRDQNTCNTMTIGDDEVADVEDDSCDKMGGVTSDIDRTSPIDTLSMPLMELNQQPHAKLITCQEQLKRLPLMGPKHSSVGNTTVDSKKDNRAASDTSKQSKSKDDEIDDDQTSIVGSYSTPLQEERLKKHEKSQLVVENSSPIPKRSYADDDDCEEKVPSYKKQRTIPSSPTTMFNYQDEASSQGDDDEHNDLFSSFINGSRPSNHDEMNDTPATQYQNQSSDNIK
ncbi:hypothetical protein ZYGR_0AN00430 [Zygosaccharomyces rouxii]|uniref:Ams2/SPT21 N-terminal domain-containing protein n=1 Tax=Zygosaccharomyces rouxii TaxID=4956 RepID=A0A1Q3AG26_ZYGRO|nr:hypothetical protein ZYGR_0AN00430 [Zygosaccharomyces rouxii]